MADFTNPLQQLGDKAKQPSPSRPVKPEVDLQTWAALGGNAKPSRTDRRQKRGWKRGSAR